MSKCRKSIVTLAFSFLIAFCVALVPVKAMASTQYGEIYEWTGDINVSMPTGILHLDSTYTQNQVQDETNINSVYTTATYRGNALYFLDLEGSDEGYLNGLFWFPVTFTVDVNTGATPYYVMADVCQSEVEGINLFSSIDSLNPNSITVRLYIEFDNYYIDNNAHLPLYFDLSYSETVNSNLHGVIGFKATGNSRSDWAGSVTVYTDVRDTPGYYGDSSRIEQDIVDGLVDNTWAINNTANNIINTITDFKNWNIATIREFGQGIIDNIQACFYDLSVNLSNWYNGLISNLNTNFDRLLNQNNDEHEETINGYQGTGTSDASSRFDQSAGELENVESDLTNITNSSIDNYTDTAFDTSVIASLGSSLVYVVTWFTNFWNMGGLFTSILNVGLALSVAFFILRLRGGS